MSGPPPRRKKTPPGRAASDQTTASGKKRGTQRAANGPPARGNRSANTTSAETTNQPPPRKPTEKRPPSDDTVTFENGEELRSFAPRPVEKISRAEASAQETADDLEVISERQTKKIRKSKKVQAESANTNHNDKPDTKRQKSKASPNTDGDVHISKIAFRLCLLVLLLGWCASANAYRSSTLGNPDIVEVPHDGAASILMGVVFIWEFFRNSIAYLPELPSVVGFVFREKIAIPFVMAAAMIGIWGFVLLTRKVEQNLQRGYDSAYRRKRKATEERKARARRKRSS